jgi:predicted nucleotidyltransferase
VSGRREAGDGGGHTQCVTLPVVVGFSERRWRIIGMIQLIDQMKPQLFAICRDFGVRTLDVFGSAATGTFDSETSDLDFVIDFLDYGPGIGRRFFEFGFAVEDLFGRSVDLVFDSEMKNPYFRSAVNKTRESCYCCASQ